MLSYMIDIGPIPFLSPAHTNAHDLSPAHTINTLQRTRANFYNKREVFPQHGTHIRSHAEVLPDIICLDVYLVLVRVYVSVRYEVIKILVILEANELYIIFKLRNIIIFNIIIDYPEQFRPERFLDAAGNIINKDLVITFSIGISVYLQCCNSNNNNDERFILRRKMPKHTQRRRSLHIGKMYDQHL